MYHIQIKTALKNEQHFPAIAEALEDFFDGGRSEQKVLMKTWNLYFTIGVNDGETSYDEGKDIEIKLDELATKLDIRIETRMNGKGADDQMSHHLFHGPDAI